ncbi:MAG TPA: carboxymuconolactone decarboxylase family protein [Actinomycetes bacterium]|nr:carboxymuconolactone decarboxylase family protein [Actinomycetes bacterium]
MTSPKEHRSSHHHSPSSATPDVSYGEAVRAELRDPAKELRRAIPDVYEGFKALSSAALTDGVLERKTKELIALALSVGAQCDGCISSHARSVARAGASEQEVAEALGVCILMMGGPGTVYAPRAFAAFREYVAT